jgi:lysophospholipase
MRRLLLPVLCCFLEGGHLAAVPEKDHAQIYANKVNPFLSSGERFSFLSADGATTLQGIRFLQSDAKGTVVVLNGSTESWLKYGELFYDLHLHGYNVVSYDHRGQGLSPHLVTSHPQIHQIDDFNLYAADLNKFVQKEMPCVRPQNLYLLAHSMGGAVAIDYLQHYPSPFRAVVLSAPMIRINTAPYPEWVARLVMEFLHLAGQGNNYAPGKHDRDPKEPFGANKITSSRARWQEIQRVWDTHPEAVLGGPSNEWVKQALEQTATIRRRETVVDTPTLILEAGNDTFVINPSKTELQRLFRSQKTLFLEGSKHEILMEKDPIRDAAIKATLDFFGN